MVELNGNIFWGLIQMMNSFKAGTQPFQLAAAIGNCCRACRRGGVLRQKKNVIGYVTSSQERRSKHATCTYATLSF